MNKFVQRFVSEWLLGLGRLSILTNESLRSLFTLKVTWRDYLYQLYFIGVKSQSVVLVMGGLGLLTAPNLPETQRCRRSGS